MARIRTIKPEFFADEDLATCSPHARLLAIALLQLADSEGRMRLIPAQIAAHAFPWEAVDLSPLLHELFTISYARKYRVSGREYLEIPGFRRHQRLSGKEAASKSKFPAYPTENIEEKEGEAKGKNFPLHGEADGIPGTGEQGNRGTGEQGVREPNGSCRAKPPDDAPPKDKPVKPTNADAREVLEYLNAKSGRNFEPVDANLTPIKARIGEYGPDKLRAVVDAKVIEWQNDEAMSKFLRPATLFNATKCAQYVGELKVTRLHGGQNWQDDPWFRGAL